jgi:methylase of polypeptide subunit release factors
MTLRPGPVFNPEVVTRLRAAVTARFTSDLVADALGLPGQAALSRADLVGAARALASTGRSTTATLIRLFLLGHTVALDEAVRALAPLDVAAGDCEGLLESHGGGVRAVLDLRPYRESGGTDWWVISDLGADVRPGPLSGDHVLGIGAAATTLAQSTVRMPAERALDVGTGCGVQALHLSRHCQSITATDLSSRALTMAATTAALNGFDWDLRLGSLLEPVAKENFDLIVCNPPFIVGPGFTADSGGHTYRDSGLSGDAVSRHLVTGLPGLLRPGGTAQLLANWAITAEEPWQDRIAGWLDGTDCDAWVWQREVAEPGEYIALWLRDAGLQPTSAAWRTSYDHWLDWFVAHGVLAVGMGLVNIRAMPGAADITTPRVVIEDVPQPVQQPVGGLVVGWFERQAWLRREGRPGLLASRLRAGDELVYEQRSLIGPEGWDVAMSVVRQSGGMRWEVEVDQAVAGVIAACTGQLALSSVLDTVASLLGENTDEVIEALLPVVSDLVVRGILLPPSFSPPA